MFLPGNDCERRSEGVGVEQLNPYVPGPEAEAIGDRIDSEALDAKPGWQARVNALMDELAEIEERENG